MDENKTPRPQEYYDEDEIDLLDLLLVLARRKWFIIKTTFIFAVLAIAYALLATPIYRAETQVIPPQSGSGAMAALAQMGVPDFAAGMLGVTTPSDTLVAIVKSRPVLDKVIDKFGLMDREPEPGPLPVEAIKEGINTLKEKLLPSKESASEEEKPKFRSDIRRGLANATSATADTKSGIITISVSDTSPDLAAEIANEYVAQLQELMQSLAFSQASQQRLFLEDQVKDAQYNLLQAERNLSEYQIRTGILDVGEQTSAVMEGLIKLRAEVTAKEVELRSTQTFATANNPKVKRLQSELASLKEQLKRMEASTGSTMPSDISIKDLPDAGLEYLRLMRDMKFNETLYGMLLKQYESARISEAQEPSVVQVLAQAEPPERRSKPKRKLIVVLATVLGGFIGVFGAFLKEFAANAQSDPERSAKMTELKKHLSLFKKR
ncbi:lipopolysaccharide biosynthesis protein [Dethiosulfovibrio peptidovorans DSM 11002]|uniref:Lipopolysaccharide biosynthesis protein n=1 Tax=Dethiosulfovibrio peptidovorans DSM 11002 TaxID=469381 RepID=D2Z5Q4_9BACT|nr:Wzz/FepE/Etk N-terminal domain-containing protein [Dethiosulfovibrio peptidovorans]EFC90801.1 lipopolysaccharide biosynthesis protein [Dethiosulfovibrio peptidovorans DSM 11002]